MGSDIDDFLIKKSQEFSAKIGKSLAEKKRISDLRILFSSKCRSKWPTLTVEWATKHTGPAKILLANYDTPYLERMMDIYIQDTSYHEHGVSFMSFYMAREKLSHQITLADQKAAAMATRKDTPKDPEAKDLEAFKSSPFYKKLPRIFQEKIGAGQKENV